VHEGLGESEAGREQKREGEFKKREKAGKNPLPKRKSRTKIPQKRKGTIY